MCVCDSESVRESVCSPMNILCVCERVCESEKGLCVCRGEEG